MLQSIDHLNKNTKTAGLHSSLPVRVDVSELPPQTLMTKSPETDSHMAESLKANSQALETDSYGSYQQTLHSSVHFEGKAVHSGVDVTITVHPADANCGITFQRLGYPPIKAHCDFLEASDLCTRLSDGVSHIDTIEHLMAAFAACGIDNARVVVDGEEMPIMDGSALPFVTRFADVGVVRLPVKRKFMKIIAPFDYQDGDRSMCFDPVASIAQASMTVDIDFSLTIPEIGKQSFHQDMQPESIRTNIMSARTFGLDSERLSLSKNDKALGSSCDNALLYSDDGTLLTPGGTRFEDECVRHKMLDLIGDLYVAGWPVIAKIHATRPGHSFNGKVLRALLQSDCVEIV